MKALRVIVWVMFGYFRLSPLSKKSPQPPFLKGGTRTMVGSPSAALLFYLFTHLCKRGSGEFSKGGVRTNVIQFTSYQPILPTPFHEDPE